MTKECIFDFEFERTEKDFSSLIKVVRSKAVPYWLPPLLSGGSVLFAAILGSFAFGPDSSEASAFVIGAGLTLIIYCIITPMVHVKWLSDKGAFLGPISITFDASGLHVRKSNFNAHYDWTGILSISKVKGYVFVGVDKAEGYLIPLEAFKNDGEKEELIEFVQSRVVEI